MSLKGEKSRRFGDLTYQEIGKRTQQGWLAVIPTGCTEQQGPHLPVAFDTWFAETLMVAAAEKAAQDHAVQALVLPTIPFGPTPEHRRFGSGFIDLPLPLHHALIEAILTSLATQGFQRMVLWRGCGGHDLATVVDRFNQIHQGKAIVGSCCRGSRSYAARSCISGKLRIEWQKLMNEVLEVNSPRRWPDSHLIGVLLFCEP